jgi:hypothetical protein
MVFCSSCIMLCLIVRNSNQHRVVLLAQRLAPYTGASRLQQLLHMRGRSSATVAALLISNSWLM